mgnify:CR=1 FL=1
MRKHKINPATKDHIYFCEHINTIHPYSDDYNGNDTLYYFEMIALDTWEVLKWEKGKDWLFFVDPNKHPDNANDSSKCAAENSDKCVSFWDLTNLFKIGPTDLSRIIYKSGVQPYYRDGNGFDGYQIKPVSIGDDSPSWLFDEGIFHRFEFGRIKKFIDEQDEAPGQSDKTQQGEDESSALKAENSKNRSLIDSLELSNSNLAQKLAEIRQENESLKAEMSEVVPQAPTCENCASIQDAEQRLADLETVNQDLQSRLEAALAGRPRWLPSCIALFQASKQVIESDRGDWIKDEFFSLAESLYVNPGDNQGVLGEAREEAWKALPKQFKAGPGNQKNKGNPTKE